MWKWSFWGCGGKGVKEEALINMAYEGKDYTQMEYKSEGKREKQWYCRKSWDRRIEVKTFTQKLFPAG